MTDRAAALRDRIASKSYTVSSDYDEDDIRDRVGDGIFWKDFG